MAEQHLMDIWGKLEVEWRDALEHAMTRQREYDSRMTNHLVYNLAAPDIDEREEISRLWQEVYEKRKAANDFIVEHANKAENSHDG